MVRKLPVIIGSLCAFSASGACSKEGSYHRMSDLRWLCEVVHTWGETLVGRCPSGVSRSVGTMSDAHDVQRCDFCKRGRVTRRNQRISFLPAVPLEASQCPLQVALPAASFSHPFP